MSALELTAVRLPPVIDTPPDAPKLTEEFNVALLVTVADPPDTLSVGAANAPPEAVIVDVPDPIVVVVPVRDPAVAWTVAPLRLRLVTVVDPLPCCVSVPATVSVVKLSGPVPASVRPAPLATEAVVKEIAAASWLSMVKVAGEEIVSVGMVRAPAPFSLIRVPDAVACTVVSARVPVPPKTLLRVIEPPWNRKVGTVVVRPVEVARLSCPPVLRLTVEAVRVPAVWAKVLVPDTVVVVTLRGPAPAVVRSPPESVRLVIAADPGVVLSFVKVNVPTAGRISERIETVAAAWFVNELVPVEVMEPFGAVTVKMPLLMKLALETTTGPLIVVLPPLPKRMGPGPSRFSVAPLAEEKFVTLMALVGSPGAVLSRFCRVKAPLESVSVDRLMRPEVLVSATVPVEPVEVTASRPPPVLLTVAPFCSVRPPTVA